MKKKRPKLDDSPPGEDLRVDIDWSSTGIWTGKENLCYSQLNLPDWLVSRFEYWTGWYNSHAPWKGETIDQDLFDAYGLSLAVDLKRVVGERHRVFHGSRKKEIVVVNESKGMAGIPPGI